MAHNTSPDSAYASEEMMVKSRMGYYGEKKRFFSETLQRLQHTDMILDIACNDGELTTIYAAYGKTIGIDINPEAIKACRQRGLECICCKVEDLSPRYDNSFDVIIAGDIIEHVFDTDSFLSAIHKLLKPSGSLLLSTPNIASLGRRLMLLAGINPFVEFSTRLPNPVVNVGHIRYYTQKNMQDQLALCKFRNINIYGDRINIGPNMYIPYPAARHIPHIARNLLVHAIK